MCWFVASVSENGDVLVVVTAVFTVVVVVVVVLVAAAASVQEADRLHCWHYRQSMRNRVYEMVPCLSVCSSVCPSMAHHSNKPAAAGLLLISMDCCCSGV